MGSGPGLTRTTRSQRGSSMGSSTRGGIAFFSWSWIQSWSGMRDSVRPRRARHHSVLPSAHVAWNAAAGERADIVVRACEREGVKGVPRGRSDRETVEVAKHHAPGLHVVAASLRCLVRGVSRRRLSRLRSSARHRRPSPESCRRRGEANCASPPDSVIPDGTRTPDTSMTNRRWKARRCSIGP